MKSESDALWSSPGGSACPRPQGKATEGRMFASVAPREVLARLRRGVAKPQVKPLIGVSDPYTSPRRPKRRRARPRPRKESFTPHGPFAPPSAPGSPSGFRRAGRSCGTPCAMGRSGTSSWRARCDSPSSPNASRFRGDRPFLPFLRSARRTTTHWSGLSGTSRPGRVALRRPSCARRKSGRDAFNRGRSCSASAKPTGSCMRG